VEGLLKDLYQRGLNGKDLQLITTDGCPGLAGAIQAVYPCVLHQRCLVHKMRNISEKGRKRDRDELKQMAQAIYLTADRKGGVRRSAVSSCAGKLSIPLW
jgi:putative transposase